MKLKLIGAGIAALTMLAGTYDAQAADIPRPVYKGYRPVVAYYNWTGFYTGINAGYGFGKSSWSASAVDTKPDGFLIGGTLGYNYQMGSWVWGIEGDIAWSNMKGDATCLGFTCTTQNEWLGTLRGRIGYAFDRFLPYITAGGAYGDIRATDTNPATAGSKDSNFGWTAGAGIEYAFMGSWTAKLEYLYVDLGDFNCGTACHPAVSPNNVDLTTSIVRVGLNYKFSGPIFGRW